MIGFAIQPATDEAVDEVIHTAEQAVDVLPDAFQLLGSVELGEVAFDRIRQTAIYTELTKLEGSVRDERLAAYALAGREPNHAVADEMQGLREMTRDRASTLAREYLRFDRATVVVAAPRGAVKRGRRVEVEAAPVHDVGRRRDPPDPADAHRPIAGIAIADTTTTVRTLPNGLRVVLRPETSVPTIDIRLVFDAGTADEPTAKRGSAIVAGYGLGWDFHYLNDFLLFSAAGGQEQVDVGFDQTTFGVRGVDMHLDILLAGLRRLVRNGKYSGADDTLGDALRRQAKNSEKDEEALSNAWRNAAYGSGHPYVAAGRPRTSRPTTRRS